MNQSSEQDLILITVSGPQKKGGHNVYSITGKDKNGQFSSVRRYSDFDNLRSVLSSRWPGCYIPSLPEKKFLGNENSTFIQVRKQGFEYFLNVLKQLKHLWYSQENQLFLRKFGETQKQFSKMKQTTLSQIVNRYRAIFPDYFDKQISKQMNTEIIEFIQYLKKATGLLQNLEKMASQISHSRKKCVDLYFNLINTVIPEYQKNCITNYMNQNNLDEIILTGQRKQKLIPLVQELRLTKNSVLHVQEQIKRQKLEVNGFEQVLKIKQNYSAQKQKSISKVKDLEIESTKIHAGKQSLFSKITKKSKQDQLKQNEASVQKAQQQQNNLTLLCQVITLLLGLNQINKFKSLRQKSYYYLLKRFFELEKQQSQQKKHLWTLILKDNSQKEEIDNFFQSQKTPQKFKQQQSQNMQQKLKQQQSISTEIHSQAINEEEKTKQQEQAAKSSEDDEVPEKYQDNYQAEHIELNQSNDDQFSPKKEDQPHQNENIEESNQQKNQQRQEQKQVEINQDQKEAQIYDIE